ncbi:MAG TPA: MarR family transcriptional regulator [Ilumatobacteraceae bacterium]|nr:MarR family transcriptional regulator [Ilumatobacteraceae bacterium]HRB02080.1 MarR family transcriptional regulator [Ilumatobacteraceae bacterium]
MAHSIPAREQLAVEVADLVHRVAHDARRSAKEQLAPLGITWGQVRALRTVAAADGPVRMGTLADTLGMVPRSATSVVEDLVEQGLVTRSDDPADRRAVAVEPTVEGRDLLARVVEQRRAAAGQALSALTLDELETVRRLLAKALADPAEPRPIDR